MITLFAIASVLSVTGFATSPHALRGWWPRRGRFTVAVHACVTGMAATTVCVSAAIIMSR